MFNVSYMNGYFGFDNMRSYFYNFIPTTWDYDYMHRVQIISNKTIRNTSSG